MVKGSDKFEAAGIGGMTYQQALDITAAFLEWYQEWLMANDPGAFNSVNSCEQLATDLGGTDFDEMVSEGEEE